MKEDATVVVTGPEAQSTLLLLVSIPRISKSVLKAFTQGGTCVMLLLNLSLMRLGETKFGLRRLRAPVEDEHALVSRPGRDMLPTSISLRSSTTAINMAG